MKRISAPTMIEDGRLSGSEPAARWFDETARHQFLRECELEGLITERTAYGPSDYLSSLHAHRTKLADQATLSYFALSTAIACSRVAVYPARSCMPFGDPSRDCSELVPMEEASALLLSVRLRPRDNSQLLNPIIS